MKCALVKTDTSKIGQNRHYIYTCVHNNIKWYIILVNFNTHILVKYYNVTTREKPPMCKKAH